jgi:hypothetical protein
MTGWIVITGHAVTGAGRIEIVWASDLDCKPTVRSAISHGFQTIGSDDFRIGRVKNGALQALQWMDEAPRYYDDMERTAENIGLKCRRVGLDDGPRLPRRNSNIGISGR